MDRVEATPFTPTSPQGYQLVNKIDELVSNASKWDNYNAWVESKERQQFYNIVDRIERKSEEQGNRGYKLEWGDVQSNDYSPKNSGSRLADERTMETIEQISNKSDDTQEARRKSSIVEKTLFERVPHSIVCLRRKVIRVLPTVDYDGKKHHLISNLSQLSYFMFFDMFKAMNFEAFCSYKYLLLLSDLSWLDGNKSLPTEHRYLNGTILKKFITDYYVLVQRYSTKQILENYDLDFVLDAYFRAVMIAKGCKNKKVKDFGVEVSMQDWIDHHERSCGIKGIWHQGVRQGDGDLQLDMQGFKVMIRKRGGKFLVLKDNI